MVHLTAGGQDKKKKGRVSQTVDQARQKAKDEGTGDAQRDKGPGKMQRLKTAIVAELPYHKQSLPVGTQFTPNSRLRWNWATKTPRPRSWSSSGARYRREASCTCA